MSDSRVSVKEHDFLEQDPPLRGQNYVCLSFISPDEVIKKKDVYMFERFMEHFSKDMSEFFDNLMLKYGDEIDLIKNIQDRYAYVFDTSKVGEEYNFFVSKNSQELEDEYFEKNNFQTTIRGLKVRGTFETLREAEVRAQVLKKMDDRFHVYVAQVGCWCPWSPNPDDIANQEYAETELNTLMKGYNDNQSKKDAFYQQRKTELQNLKKSKQSDVTSDVTGSEPQPGPTEAQDLSSPDPWLARKLEQVDINGTTETS